MASSFSWHCEVDSNIYTSTVDLFPGSSALFFLSLERLGAGAAPTSATVTMAKKHSGIILGALLLLLAVQCARAATWGEFAITDDCLDGKRKWYAKLYDINGDWDAACKNTPATVHGVYFATPSNCVNRGLEGEFGEFYIPDNTCP